MTPVLIPGEAVRDIPGHAEYLVSDHGRVWSKRSCLWLVPNVDRDGYLLYHLRVKGSRSVFKAHRLVLSVFDVPQDLDVNHKDGDKQNNRLSNLEWLSRQDNIAHAKEAGLVAEGEQTGAAKLSLGQVREIRTRYEMGGVTYAQLAAEFGVCFQNIGYIIQRKTWKDDNAG